MKRVPKSAKQPKSPQADPKAAPSRRPPVGRPFASGPDPRRNTKGSPNAGRPPDVLRQQLTGSFANRLGVLESFADGDAVVKTTVRLKDLHATVLECYEVVDGKIVLKDPAMADLIEIPARTSPAPKDRIHAIEVMAKHGLGLPPQEIRAKHSGKVEVNVVVKREGRRVTAS